MGKMKYPIDKELKSISIYSGSMVGRLYPMVNFAYGVAKCRINENQQRKNHRYRRQCWRKYCLHDEGIEFAEKLKSQGVTVEVHDMKDTCHGYETAIKSSIVEKCMAWRVEWIRSLVK